MLQMALFFVLVLLTAFGFSWLSDQPGSILINFAGYERLFTPVEFIITLLVILGTFFGIWMLLQRVVNIPAVIASFFKKRREKRGLEALSAGLIAVGIGDRTASSRYASQARKSLPNEPLTALLRAQSAQMIGDRATARRIYEAMLGAPDTELLGLRGLFLEAQHENEDEAAFQFAEQAVALNPKLQWSVIALFQFQCKKGDWAGALKTLDIAKHNKHIERIATTRSRAVLLTAQAMEFEESDADKALELALEAHRIAVDLIPAADIAGRILASKGNTGKAAKVVSRTWKQNPHPDLALTYSYARPGDSPRDRMQRMQQLAAMKPDSIEGAIAIARSALDAKDWEAARTALKPLIDKDPSARVCTLMARVEGEQGDQGRMREWVARAVRAPRDPVWSGDGFVSERWLPISPLSGALDCFEWKVPVETVGGHLARNNDEVLPLDMVIGRGTDIVIADPDQEKKESRIVVKDETSKWEEDEKKEAGHSPVVTSSGSGEGKANDEIPGISSVVDNSGAEENIVGSVRPGKELVAQTSEKLPVHSSDKEEEKKLPDTEQTAPAKPKYAQRPAAQPNIYVAPHAPDDPGVLSEEDEYPVKEYVAKASE